MKNFFYLIFGLILVLSCQEKKEDSNSDIKAPSKNMIAESSEGYELLKKHCYVCHSPASTSHDEIIAPPMQAVKLHYNRRYQAKEEFVTAMVSWTMNPEEEKARMRGAVERFKIMPNQAFKEPDVRKIAEYIYDNELEEPIWFEAHRKEMHGKDMTERTHMPD